ncbi:MAG: DEAD/DEAH box helicase [Halomonas sp.]|nr:DEAD/DEAH box helicase [Halomonas sp.]TVP43917.1 MAG: DEAD/DEAH box helicase [Halomonas sp.]
MSLNPAAELMLILKSGHWKHFFDSKNMRRGEALVRQEGVTQKELTSADQTYYLKGFVEDTHRYYVQVSIEEQPFMPKIVTNCECPVGNSCQHGIALILSFIEEMAVNSPHQNDQGNIPAGSTTEHSPENQWKQWLQHIRAPAKPDVPRVEGHRRLALIVQLGTSLHSSNLRITPVWLRLSRSLVQKNTPDKQWVDPIDVKHEGSHLQPAPVDGWQEEIEEALLLLMQRGTTRYLGSQSVAEYTVETNVQQRALIRLLESNDPPLIFHGKQTGEPLSYAPNRSLKMEWRLGEDGLQRPIALLDETPVDHHRTTLFTIGETLWHLDLNRAKFGPIEGDARLFTQLQYAPGLPPDKSGWLALHVQQTPGHPTDFHPPTTLEQQRIKDTAPSLSMHIKMLSLRQPLSPSHTYTLGTGVLRIVYDGIELSPDDTQEVSIQQADKLVYITRNLEAEKSLVQQLPSEIAPLKALLGKVSQYPSPFDQDSMVLLKHKVMPRVMDQWPDCLASPQQWWPMIHQLRQLGVAVTLDDNFPSEPTYLAPGDWDGELKKSSGGWFTLSLGIELDGERVELLPLLGQLLDDPNFPLEPAPNEIEEASWDIALGDNRFVALPRKRLRELIVPIIDSLRDATSHLKTLKLPANQAVELAELAAQQHWKGRNSIRQLARAVKQLPDEVKTPPEFNGTLRPYQTRGLAWLRFLATLNIGGILADDMGLGKTIQVLAHVLDERAQGRLKGPILIVATTSLASNWLAEIKRFTPTLTPLAITGRKGDRARLLTQLKQVDIVITTYPLLNYDLTALKAQPFSLIVFDEAQMIKNPAAQTAKSVRKLSAKRRLALTGTPLENHLGELWAEVDAINPGFLGSQKWFDQHYRRPIEQHSDADARARLLRRIDPLLLRRTKQEVLTDLPAKTEIQRYVELSGKQRELYESLRLAQHERVQQSLSQRGMAHSGFVVLDALLKLRQVCCDPRLVKLDSAQRITHSAKLDLLMEILPGLIAKGRHILVFSQFTNMLGLIGEALEKDNIAFLTLTGRTPAEKRAEYIEQFQRGDVSVFLISLKAGGVGLNLTQADTVIHYDPWWNPAVEAQATGRAHRIGQKRPVFVYKLVASGTVEERIMSMQERKSALSNAILVNDSAENEKGAVGKSINEDDLAKLFAPMDS